MKNYSITILEKQLPTADYIANFRDKNRFEACCKECKNWGAQWSCPPFERDIVAEELVKYQYITIYIFKIDITSKGLPVSDAETILRPCRESFERFLLQKEGAEGGRVASTIGKCAHCGDEKCAKLVGQPCRHSDKVRPSLESLGFDLVKTAKELFDIELLWSQNNVMPPYLLLIGGHFR